MNSKPNPAKGRFILLTGLSGSGKSTLGSLLSDYLNKFGVRPAFLLDGDFARSFFENDLGHLPEERNQMSRRMAFGAKTLVENNVDVIMANIAASQKTRDFFRKSFSDYIEIFLDVDLETVVQNDVKGVYKNNLNLESPKIVGMDIPYEKPVNPNLTLKPFLQKPEESLKEILAYLGSRGPVMGTKADTLESLNGFISRAKVLEQLIVTHNLFSGNPEYYLNKITAKLAAGPYVVRSSCRGEDSKTSSNAGVFESILNVSSDMVSIRDAISQVYQSYVNKNIESAEHEQILIQPQLQNVAISGVAFSRYQYSDSPYYVINYDDDSGSTESVTSGMQSTCAYIARNISEEKLGRWKNIVLAMRELEQIFPKFPLDVEFAQDKSGDVYIFQCRALNIQTFHHSLEESALELIEELKLKFERCGLKDPHVPGSHTVLSDMADWNPAEIIGDRPSTLSYTLYRDLVTQSSWHEARASQGYFNIVNGPLMMSLAQKPYIDTRLSFASFTPQNISEELREKIVSFALSQLSQYPELHDKVEFHIIPTCYDFCVESKLNEFKTLSTGEKEKWLLELKSLTHNLIAEFPKNYAHDLKSLETLELQIEKVRALYDSSTNYWENFHGAFLLLEHVRTLGIVPFARMARLGFIAQSLLSSIVELGIFSYKDRSEFLASIQTVAGEFSESLTKLTANEMSFGEFLEKFGHLRMNTYDSTSLRYDQMSESIWKNQSAPKDNTKAKYENPFETHKQKLEDLLKSQNFEVTVKELEEFCRTATKEREGFKFIFTKGLSEAIEYINRAGKVLGLDADDIKHAALPTLLRYRNPELTSIAKTTQLLKNKISERKKERSVFDLIKLPPVIRHTKDLEIVEFRQAKPNFITDKKVMGDVIFVSSHMDPKQMQLEDKIVYIENADPGYDWIFGFNIKALVTKYGGVASHMSIRCAEFNLAGAIGCGEILAKGIEKSNSLLLDCKAGLIRFL